MRHTWVVRPSLRSCVIRVPYYFGDLKNDPNLENFPHVSADSNYDNTLGMTSGPRP